MSKINLIPEVKQEQLKVQKVNGVVTTVAATVAIVFGVVIVGIVMYNVARLAQLNSIKNNINSAEKNLVPYADLEKTELSLETGVAEIKNILAGKKDWNVFFAEIEKATPNDVQIQGLTVNQGTVTMALKGKDVRSVDRFVKSFSSYKIKTANLFSSVVVDSYSKVENGFVSFNASMSYDEGALWQQTK